MVKVNSLNFVESLPGLAACLERAEFVSFDLEMTGIMGTERNPKDDGVEERYQRMSPTATKYSIIQVGLCFFERSVTGEGYVASPYSFFVFPEWGPDLIMSPGSITFLKKNGMDFNEWINHGLSFVNSNGATKMREQRAERAAAATAATAGGSTNQEPPSTLMPNRPAEIEQMNALKASIAQWAADPNSAAEFVVPAMNPFLRRCVYAHVEAVHPELKTRKDDAKPNEIVILKVTEEQRVALTLEEEAMFKRKLGFRVVFEMLQAAGKPIVGHNCFFDLLFLFRWFEGPLPSSFSAFRGRFAELFPAGVYDTKYSAESNLIPDIDPMQGDTALQPLYEKVVAGMGEGLVSFASPEMEYKGADKQAHDAGYDAFMTGVIHCRLRLAAGVDTIRDKAWNRLFLMQSLYSFSLEPNKENPNLLRYVCRNFSFLSIVRRFPPTSLSSHSPPLCISSHSLARSRYPRCQSTHWRHLPCVLGQLGRCRSQECNNRGLFRRGRDRRRGK